MPTPFQAVLHKFRKQSFSERDKGARFERLMQAYLFTDPKYAPQFKNVWLWNEFPAKKDFGGKDLYYSKHESERILEQMKGTPYKGNKSDTYTKETLKMAYVGMSRPQYLLCYAIHCSRYHNDLNIENGGMWEVINTDEES